TASGMEPHGKTGNAGFVNQWGADLRLLAGSPAIDAGKTMSFDELGWTQTYRGKAPDIGAYEDNELVDGPAFRFRMPDSAQFSYRETPRMVKYRVDKNRLTVYFSAAINPATLAASTILLQNNGKRIDIKQTGFPGNPFELVIETNTLLQQNHIALGFRSLPAGANGQPVTWWASAIPVIKL
ncbi:MAG TPA: choice-of-anchor Q domain-containing protein, partial [Chitinophagaceae bacterium]|nr:choice-of-anchor Q domain-containing protein [Chitinophagaceae bacterium]